MNKLFSPAKNYEDKDEDGIANREEAELLFLLAARSAAPTDSADIMVEEEEEEAIEEDNPTKKIWKADIRLQIFRAYSQYKYREMI